VCWHADRSGRFHRMSPAGCNIHGIDRPGCSLERRTDGALRHRLFSASTTAQAMYGLDRGRKGIECDCFRRRPRAPAADHSHPTLTDHAGNCTGLAPAAWLKWLSDQIAQSIFFLQSASLHGLPTSPERGWSANLGHEIGAKKRSFTARATAWWTPTRTNRTSAWWECT